MMLRNHIQPLSVYENLLIEYQLHTQRIHTNSNAPTEWTQWVSGRTVTANVAILHEFQQRIQSNIA